MHAVLKTGGKQYRVAKDDVITIEKINGEPGSEISFRDVLILGDKIGNPLIEGAVVSAKIIEQKKDAKIIVFKKKRRKDYKRTQGHKQLHTVVQITSISSSAGEKKTAKKEAPESQSKTTDKKSVQKKTATKKTVAKKTSVKKTATKTTVSKEAGKEKVTE
tara:strand:+ start:71 stop:553 length:483 start_codon:yes stop_codon:yes gene_type:complete